LYLIVKVSPCLQHLVEVIMKELNTKVKKLRRIKGWAQEDLAREMGVSLSTIQRWESRGGNPTRLARRELRKIFKEAGIEVDD
jgi:transcriptional regulator with XRE-family HTH domain